MPSAAPPPPLPVLRALSVPIPPFKPSSTRRDLSTSFRAFTTAWTSLSQATVLPAACARLGERAAEVLMAVEEVLREVEEKEREERGGKVVLERSYEFQGGGGGGKGRREASEGGEAGQGGGGSTVFKVQSTMLDLSMFATDFLATSTNSRLSLLVNNLHGEQKKLRTLTSSLLSCITAYSLSAPSTATWTEKDAADQFADGALLPRLFQLSIALRGPVYDAFLASTSGTSPTAHETPGKKRAAFVKWCHARNSLLKPKDGAASPPPAGSTIRRGSKIKDSWPPPAANDDGGIGLGLPKGLYASSPTPARRAVSQPAVGAADSPSPLTSPAPPKVARFDSEPALAVDTLSPPSGPPADISLSPSCAPETSSTDASTANAPLPSGLVAAHSPIEGTSDILVSSPSKEQDWKERDERSEVEEKAETDSLPPTSPPVVISLASADDDSPLPCFPDAAPLLSSDSPPSLLPPPILTASSVEPPPTPAPVAPTAKAETDEDDPLLSLARRDSAASSVAMTVSGSAGSRLFEEETLQAVEEGGNEAKEEERVEEEGKVEEVKEVKEKVGKREGEKVEEEKGSEPAHVMQDAPGLAEEDNTRVADDAPDAGSDNNPPTAEKEEVASSAVPPVHTLPAPPGTGNDIKQVSVSPPLPVAAEVSESTQVEGGKATVPPPSPSVEPSPPVPIIAVEGATDASPPAVQAPALPVATVSPPSPPSVSSPLSSSATPPSVPFRILSLDGCGIVGPIPQLLLLKQYLTSLPSSPSPSQHFDLIVGTSTSALLAILLGHLGLSIDDALSVWTAIAKEAFALELRPAGGAARAKPKRGVWSRLFGRGGGGASAPSGTFDEPTRRAGAFDKALVAFLPQANEPFSGGASRVAILAFERGGSGTQERWLSNQGGAAEHGLTVGEVIKASLAASSSFPTTSRWTRSPASLNPSASALAFARSSVTSPAQPISLLSLSSGYSSLSLDANALRRLSKTRLAALREVKQLAASNAVAAASLAKKVEGHKGVEVQRLEVDCARCGLAEGREEWETVDTVQAAITGKAAKPEQRKPSIRIPSIPLTPSTPLLSPSSPTTPKSDRKRASRFSFFGLGGDKSSSSSNSGPTRRASSFVPALATDDALHVLPLSPTASLAPPLSGQSRGLRTSVSMNNLSRREFSDGVGGVGSEGIYGLREAAGSSSSLRGA